MMLPTITWKYPSNSVFFILYAFTLMLLCWRWKRHVQLISFLSKQKHSKKFLQHISKASIAIKNILWAILLFFLFLVLLHPSWDCKQELIKQEGRDLFIALDISRSMLAQDVTPHRLAVAKKIIKKIVDQLQSTRVGLILFSATSFIQCPLTKDKAAFFMYLDQIDIDTIAGAGTALEKPIAQALDSFSQSNSKNKLLIIVTDGEDFSTDLSGLKQQAKQQNLNIFTIGVGTSQGAPIPVHDALGKQIGHIKDKKGAIVISRLDNALLENLAHELDGIYLSDNNAGDQAIEKLISIVHTKEKNLLGQEQLCMQQEQYPWFLIIVLLLLLLEWIL